MTARVEEQLPIHITAEVTAADTVPILAQTHFAPFFAFAAIAPK